MNNLVLASTSVYRKKLLEGLGLPFDMQAPQCDEDHFKALGLPPKDLAIRLATEKAKSVFNMVQANNPTAFVIASDQVVALGQEILGKPGTTEIAYQSLWKCSGRTVVLTTAVSVLGPKFERHFEVSATMKFTLLSDGKISQYLAKDQPFDCAGSFKYESLGHTLFEQVICDDLTTIEGLPMKRLKSVLIEAGFHPKTAE